MSLSNSQYDSIMREYSAQQTLDRNLLDQRTEEVCSLIPEYSNLKKELDKLHEETADRFLSGDKNALIELRAKVTDIINKQDQLLIQNGFSSNYLEAIYKCPDCQDTGYIGNEKCHCFRQKEARILYQHSNLEAVLQTENFSKLSEKYYSGADLEHFRKAVQNCHDFIDEFDSHHRNICFMGSVGTGKSFLSCCIAHDLIDSGHSVLYFSAVRLFQLLTEASFRKESSLSISSVMDDFSECDLLIIDDLGTENTTQFMASNLFSCINERINRNKSTIISTNLSLEEIRDRYSDRIFSRITSCYEIYRLECPDIRIENKIDQKRK